MRFIFHTKGLCLGEKLLCGGNLSNEIEEILVNQVTREKKACIFEYLRDGYGQGLKKARRTQVY